MKVYGILIVEDYENSHMHDKVFKTSEEAIKECNAVLKSICGKENGDNSTWGIVQEMEIVE